MSVASGGALPAEDWQGRAIRDLAGEASTATTGLLHPSSDLRIYLPAWLITYVHTHTYLTPSLVRIRHNHKSTPPSQPSIHHTPSTLPPQAFISALPPSKLGTTSKICTSRAATCPLRPCPPFPVQKGHTSQTCTLPVIAPASFQEWVHLPNMRPPMS